MQRQRRDENNSTLLSTTEANGQPGINSETKVENDQTEERSGNADFVPMLLTEIVPKKIAHQSFEQIIELFTVKYMNLSNF